MGKLKYNHKLLLVDDEESILKALRRVFRKEPYTIYTASSGQEGLNILKEAKEPFSLIISDQRMPRVSGTQFLEQAKELSPETIRILLTGYSDLDAIIDAVNSGGIHRYLTKPWNGSELLIQIRQSLEQYELAAENRRLLELIKTQNRKLNEINKDLEKKVSERSKEIIEKNKRLSRLNRELENSLYNTVRALGTLVGTHHPSLAGHGRRVSILSREIAQSLGLPEKEVTEIDIAALLHDIGKIGFPKKLLEYRQNKWDSQDRELFYKHPLLGQETVQFINRLDNVGILIRCHHEQYDGHGYPSHLAEEEIPLGSRIIAVANVYDKIVNLKITSERSVQDTLAKIKAEQSRLSDHEALKKAAIAFLKQNTFSMYDPDVIKAFLNLLKTRDILYGEEKEISIEETKVGMVLSRPLYSHRGRFLLPHNTTLSEDHVRKLKTLNDTDPIKETVYVYASGEAQKTKEEN